MSLIVKVLSGVFLAVMLLTGTGFAVAQYLIAQYSQLPPRPVFPNDKSASKSKGSASKDKAAAAKALASDSSQAMKPDSGDGYKARVIQEIGLNIRQSPSQDGERIGGVDYNEEVTVLEESADKAWQRIRLESQGIEGWVKGGYTEKLN